VILTVEAIESLEQVENLVAERKATVESDEAGPRKTAAE
jgi:hypothetical protein